MKRGMKLISNAVLLATIVNINLYASSKDWENIDNLEKSGKIEESVKLKNQLIDTIKKDYLKQYPKEELGLKALENISQLQPQIQEILFKCFDLGIEKIKDEKIQKNKYKKKEKFIKENFVKYKEDVLSL